MLARPSALLPQGADAGLRGRRLPRLRRKFERFFEHFHEYDNIVVATFPTCHDPTLRELLRLGLPQRYIALVRPGTAGAEAEPFPGLAGLA